MEGYLKEQHDVIEFSEESEILPFFIDNGRDYFECGVGEYQDEATKIVCVGDSFFKVLIKAEVTSRKTEYGDRFYEVEDISSVVYTKTDKPEKLPEKIKYILINVNYDENETEKTEHPSVESLREEFCGDEEILGELLNEGVFEWEWGVWHLINLGDY